MTTFRIWPGFEPDGGVKSSCESHAPVAARVMEKFGMVTRRTLSVGLIVARYWFHVVNMPACPRFMWLFITPNFSSRGRRDVAPWS